MLYVKVSAEEIGTKIKAFQPQITGIGAARDNYLVIIAPCCQTVNDQAGNRTPVVARFANVREVAGQLLAIFS